MTYTSTQRGGRTNLQLRRDDLTPAQLLRLTRIGRELRLTDQILSTDMDTVNIVDDGPAPAWTTLDGDAVSFAINKMPGLKSRVDVAVWLGTNAHELGHVLFSPRSETPLMLRVLEGEKVHLRGIAQLANIVEDQRQERLLLAQFAPWESYLTAALGHHLVADDESAWLLMTGRTWLPDSVRAEARRLFVARWGESTAVEVTNLVGAYQRLDDPGTAESDDAWLILVTLHNIFDTQMPPMPRPCTVIRGKGTGNGSGGEVGDDMPDAADEAAAPGEGQPSDAPSKPMKPGDMKKEIKAQAKRDLDDPDNEAADELDDIIDALDYGRGAGDEASGRSATGSNVAATDAARRLRYEISDALLELKDESEPGWVKRTSSGRLNVRRLLNPNCDADEIFDSYRPGQMDSSEMEVALVLDVSGSMRSAAGQLAEATWAIRHAVDDLDGSCTVIAFDSGPHGIVAQPGERPDDRMFVPETSGGTDPTSALREAHLILANSQATNRLLIILTDGDWYTSDKPEASIAATNDAGVTTMCALLGSDVKENLHGCTHGGRVDTPYALARQFAVLAAQRIHAHM